MYSSFKTNLLKFQPYEIEAAARVCKMSNVNTMGFNNDNKYDFMTSDGLKYEVKCEPSSLKTGNFFIEFKGYGKPSGLSVTEADFYIFTNSTEYFLISIEVLKHIVNGYRIVLTKDKLTYGYLVPVYVIARNSVELN